MSNPRSRPAVTGTILGLAALALISGALGLWFVDLWGDHLEEREISYFERQCRVRGTAMSESLDRLAEDFVEVHAARTDQAWVADFPNYFRRRLESRAGRRPAFLVEEVSLLVSEPGPAAPGGVVATVGDVLDSYPEAGPPDENGVSIALRSREDEVDLVYWGRIRLPENSPPGLVRRGYRFRAHHVVPPFGGVTDSGRNYAAILVVAYWLMLWIAVVAVYLVGRRQQSLAFRDQERAARLEAMTSAAEGIAHEIRNPLNGIALNAQILEKLQERGAPASSDDFRRLREEVSKIRRVIDDFVSFSRLRDIELSSLDFDEAIDEVLGEMAPMLADVGAEVEHRRADDALLRADHPKLLRLLRSLLRNAGEALVDAAGARRLNIAVAGGRDEVRVRIENAGAVIDPAVLESMFDPFFTTRSSAIGLGLTLAKTIVEAHGGSIASEARPGGGLIVTFELPRRL
jgi:signal transduction histidine kinase